MPARYRDMNNLKEKPQIKNTDNFKAADKLKEKGREAVNKVKDKAKEGEQWVANRLDDTFDIILQKGLSGGEPELRSGDGPPQNDRRNSPGDILNKKGSGERKGTHLNEGIGSKVSTGGSRSVESGIGASGGRLAEGARLESKVSKVSTGALGSVNKVENVMRDNRTEDIANPRDRRDSGIGLSEIEEESISVSSNKDINAKNKTMVENRK